MRLALIAGALLVPMAAAVSDAQQRPSCWYAWVAPEAYTVQCQNGFWITYREGVPVAQGNGVLDPNASAKGGGFLIDKTTGGPSLKGDAMISQPSNGPLDAPHQGQLWGQQPLQMR